MADAKVLRSAAGPKPKARRRFLKAKLIVLGVLGLGGLVAYETGWLGWAWADGMARSLPKDEALLGYLPADTTAVAVVDLHLLNLRALGPSGAGLVGQAERIRDDVKKVLDLDLFADVDKLAVTPGLVVARGRFSYKKLGDKLVDLHYAPAEHRGVYYFVKQGQDALAVMQDEVLLWGDEARLKTALDAREGRSTLDLDEAVTGRLKAAGWKHPLIVTLRVNDDKPSLRTIVVGGEGTRAITFAAAVGNGLDVDGVVETASPPAAQALGAKLEDERQSAEALEPLVGKEVAAALAPIAKRAALAQSGAFVRLHTHADAAELDALGRALSQPGPLQDAFAKLKVP